VRNVYKEQLEEVMRIEAIEDAEREAKEKIINDAKMATMNPE